MKKKNTEVNSIIGEGSSFEGTFDVAGSIQIDGRFQGDIQVGESLVIGSTGKVQTHIKSESVVIAGTLVGDITAKDEVLLLETGRVLGDIEAPKINISEGVVVQGQVRITGGQKRDITSLITESMDIKTAQAVQAAQNTQVQSAEQNAQAQAEQNNQQNNQNSNDKKK